MPRPRASAVELTRLLGEAAEPIYVLDGERRIVYCNRACTAWLGLAEDDLLGQWAVYQSADHGASPAAVAAGLAPPPHDSPPPHYTAVVASPHDRRRACFFTLSGEDGPRGAAAVVEPRPLAEGEPDAAPSAELPPDELHDRLRRLRRHWAEWHGIDRLLGQSAAMRRVRAIAEVAADCTASVLLVGPPGSGRQHLAATIHFRRGAEAAGPLVPLACSALNAEWLGSTVRAVAVRAQAEPQRPGTLLLGDVDQLDAEAQAVLLAALAGKPFPARLMATARSSLMDLARRGEFREDLAVLLATLVIDLPRLAERRGDLPLLAQVLLEDRNAAAGKQLAGFTPEALDLLDMYSWPGNLDELAQVVAEAHSRCETALVRAIDLPQQLHLSAEAAAHPRRKEETIVLDEFLGQVERELIGRALRRSKGNKAKAARLLGVTRPRLYRRMVQLGMIAEE